MTPTDIWSQQAWNAADHIYKEIIRHPFVLQLADGTLPREVFERYIGQDSLYLGVYCRVLSHLASRLPHADMTEAFLGFAQDGVAVEKALHSLYINERPIEMSPSCLLYTSTLMAQAYETVEVEAAAILPCFWVYLKVGQHIAATMKPDNPYSDWIATYSDPAFEISSQRAIDICDRLAAEASPIVCRAMTDVFVLCTRMEWLFWHGAYENLSWPEAII